MAPQLTQLDTGSILIVGSLLMACGSAGLFVVRLSNPHLKGIGWLGAAFASGGTGALLFILSPDIPSFFSIVLCDLLVTMAYVLFHVAILAMRGGRSLWPKLGSSLLLLQLLGYLSMPFVSTDPNFRVALMGVIVSIQVGQTTLLLIRNPGHGDKLPSWFTATILASLILVNLYRSAAALFFLRHQPPSAGNLIQNIALMAFIATGLGIAFGFFWMTTAELTWEIEQIASVDPLTRIYNRRVFRDWCDREFTRTLRTLRPFSLLMMDLDHFKEINDRHGHQGGDDVLVAAVETMQDSIRGIDILGRWGGEEFVALLPGTNTESALIVAQRIRTNIEKLLIETEASPMRMTISVGIATLRNPEDSLDDMFLRADQALYLAKDGGRNQVLTMP
jgi:diguanylate cyclase (GGDEF)-like protein